MKSPDKNWRRLAAVCAAYCLLQAAVLLFSYSRDPDSVMGGDAWDYEHSAQTLIHTGTMLVSFQDPRPATLRPPGYPFFIAGLYSLFGETRPVVLLAQIGAVVGIFLLTYAAAEWLWGAAAAMTAVAFLALDANLFLRPQLLNTETLFTLLILAAMFAGIRMLWDAQKPSLRWAVALGAALMLATFVRPISYYLPFPIAAALLAWGAAAGWPRKTAFAAAALSLLPSLIGIGAWQLRNYEDTGSWSYSNVVARDLYVDKGSDIVAWRDHIPQKVAQARQEAAISPAGRTPEETHALYKAAAMELFEQHPFLLVRSLILSLGKVLLVPGETELLSYLRVPLEATGCYGDLVRLTPSEYARKWILGRPFLFGFFVFAALQLYLLYAGILLAARRVIVSRDNGRAPLIVHLFLFGVILYFLPVSSVATTGPRFRVPFTPLLALYAGWGWSSLGRFSGRRRTEPEE